MNAITRRSLLRSILGCLGITGTVVLARATPAAASESRPESDVVRRADQVARDLPADPDRQVRQLFLNGGGGRGLWGGGRGLWRNGGWPNGGRGGVAWGKIGRAHV